MNVTTVPRLFHSKKQEDTPISLHATVVALRHRPFGWNMIHDFPIPASELGSITMISTELRKSIIGCGRHGCSVKAHFRDMATKSISASTPCTAVSDGI